VSYRPTSYRTLLYLKKNGKFDLYVALNFDFSCLPSRFLGNK